MDKKIKNLTRWTEDFLNKKEVSNATISMMRTTSKTERIPLYEVAIRMNIIKPDEFVHALHEYTDFPTISLDLNVLSEEWLKKIPLRNLQRLGAIPLVKQGPAGEVMVAMSDPTNVMRLDDLKKEFEKEVLAVFATHREIEHFLENNFSSSSMKDLMEELGEVESINVVKQEETPVVEVSSESESLAVRLVDKVVMEAISMRASDIHVEPFESHIRIRVRVDGALTQLLTIEKTHSDQITARLKVLANLNSTEQRKPQDGRFKHYMPNGRAVDLRMSTMPTEYGEKIVLRVSYQTTVMTGIDELGLKEDEKRIVDRVSKSPHGMILVSGPTGSGKSTTLYGILEHVNEDSKNIVTIEDPVEKQILGVTHSAVNPKVDLTFASALRTILRQDPDIVMVGEIRDGETAKITADAAQTGHLVLSSIHSNDAAASITRLNDMGVENYTTAEVLRAAIAQRLMRKTCPHCAKEREATESEWTMLSRIVGKENMPQQLLLKQPEGCNLCNKTGYKGRAAIFEILVVDRKMQKMILNQAPSDEIKEYAISQGMKSLDVRAAENVISGVSSLEEMRRIIFLEE